MLALQRWRCYLQGNHFVVNYDHQWLQKIQSQAHIGDRKARWAKSLQEFDCTLEYIKGEGNAAAYALSRRPDLFAIQATQIQFQPAFLDEVKGAYPADEFLQDAIANATNRLTWSCILVCGGTGLVSCTFLKSSEPA